MASIVTPVHYGTKAKLVLKKLLAPVDDLSRWQLRLKKDICVGYYYNYMSDNWIAFDNSDNNLLILGINSQEEASFFCYNSNK